MFSLDALSGRLVKLSRKNTTIRFGPVRCSVYIYETTAGDQVGLYPTILAQTGFRGASSSPKGALGEAGTGVAAHVDKDGSSVGSARPIVSEGRNASLKRLAGNNDSSVVVIDDRFTIESEKTRRKGCGRGRNRDVRDYGLVKV